MAAKKAKSKTKEAPQHSLTIIVLSGGTGRTGEGVVNAAMAQFERKDVVVKCVAGIRSVRSAVRAMREAAELHAIVCHTIVALKIREAVAREAERRMVPTVDVLGPTLAVLQDQLGGRPKGRAGLSYAVNKERFDRMDAVDFTLAHDDGARLSDIDRSDVVLVGASRVAKSVTCFYLAYRGIRAANVPLIPGQGQPRELKEMDPAKVVGLSMNAQRLQAIRSVRLQRMSMGDVRDYADLREIADELREARLLMITHGWECIDVSYKAVEEVAKEVMLIIER